MTSRRAYSSTRAATMPIPGSAAAAATSSRANEGAATASLLRRMRWRPRAWRRPRLFPAPKPRLRGARSSTIAPGERALDLVVGAVVGAVVDDQHLEAGQVLVEQALHGLLHDPAAVVVEDDRGRDGCRALQRHPRRRSREPALQPEDGRRLLRLGGQARRRVRAAARARSGSPRRRQERREVDVRLGETRARRRSAASNAAAASSLPP